MKAPRALLPLCIAAMLAASPALSRVAVVVPSEQFSGNYALGTHAYDGESLAQMVRNALEVFAHPDSFDVLQPAQVKTEWCRTGTFAIHNWNEASVVTRQYSAVIHVWVKGTLVGSGAYTPDSLTLSTRDSLGTATTNFLKVPNLLLFANGNFIQANYCSLGCNASTVIDRTAWAKLYTLMTDSTIKFVDNNDEHVGVDAAGVPGGVRKLVGANTSQWHVYNGLAFDSGNTPVRGCVDCDSTIAPVAQEAVADSGQIFVQLKANQNYAPCGTCAPVASQPLIYASVSHYVSYTGNGPTILLAALAALDSASNGGVFDKQLRVGVQIRGGFRRTQRTIPGGISPNDSTALKASIDSLAAIGVPFAVGVNIDSVGAYEAEKYWWLRAPKAHFAPENWGGIDSARAGNDIAHYYRPLDPLGYVRDRKFVGDFSMLGADTAYMASLLRRNYSLIDSIFGANRTDRALIAPGFRWVPKSFRGGAYSNQDSLAYALWLGGVRLIVANPTASYWRDQTWPKAVHASNNRVRPLDIRYGGQAGMSIPIVNTQVPTDSGSANYNRGVSSASVTQTSTQTGWKRADELDRFWTGMFHPARYRGEVSSDPAALTYAEMARAVDSLEVRDVRIFTIHASDLGSGIDANSGTYPSRPGWWSIKYLVQGARAINKLAGRTIIKIEYPQGVTP